MHWRAGLAVGLLAGVSFTGAGCSAAPGSGDGTNAGSGSSGSSGSGGKRSGGGSGGGSESSGSGSGSSSSGSSSGSSGAPLDGDSGNEASTSSDDSSTEAGVSPESGTDGGGVCPKDTAPPGEVVFLGDSYLAWSTSTIVAHIESHLQSEGSSAYSATPTRYDVSGANMAQILTQYTTAHMQHPTIDTVIMDGGGNDVLLGDRSCLTQAPPANTGCANTINTVLQGAKKGLAQMATDGVKHIVLFFYPHVETTGLSGPTANDSLDYAYPLVKSLCTSQPGCVFVDLRPAWPGDPSQYIDPVLGANVHPNEKGSQLIVDNAIWPAMQAGCVLQ